MTEDWAAVAETIEENMRLLGLNQRELAERADVALSIVRELRHNTVQRRRNGRTLEAISIALGLNRRHLAAVLAGKQPPGRDEPAPYATDDVPHQLNRIEDRLNELADRLGAMDAKIKMIIDSVFPDQNR